MGHGSGPASVGRAPGRRTGRSSRLFRPVGHNPVPVASAKRLADYENERDQDAFWEAIRPADEPLRHRWFLPAVVLILTVSVPWYLPPSVGARLAAGLPVWTWITIACGLALAVVTAFASLRLWRDAADEDGDVGDDPAPPAASGENP